MPTPPTPTIGPDTPDEGRAQLVHIVLYCIGGLVAVAVAYTLVVRARKELCPKSASRTRSQSRDTLSAAIYHATRAGSSAAFEPAAHTRPQAVGAGLAALATPSTSVYATPVRDANEANTPLYQGGYQAIA